MIRGLWKATMATAVAVAVSFGSEAKAAFTLTISSGASVATITDGGAGDLLSGQVNNIFATQMVNGYTVNVTASTNSPGLSGVGVVTQGTIAVSNNGANLGAPLTIELSSNGFTLPFSTALVSNDLSSTLLVGANSKAEAKSFLGAGSTATATILGPISGGNTSTGTTAILPNNSTISNRLVLSGLAVSTGAVATVTLTTTASSIVPEPASVIALATALPLLGLRAIRRRRTPEVATA